MVPVGRNFLFSSALTPSVLAGTNRDMEENMRSLLSGIFLFGGLMLAGSSAVSAAPANGLAIDQASNSTLLVEPVHCRKYLPHRHRGAKPHGLGFGCGKTARRTKAKRS
jgi:hypothetical protein